MNTPPFATHLYSNLDSRQLLYLIRQTIMRMFSVGIPPGTFQGTNVLSQLTSKCPRQHELYQPPALFLRGPELGFEGIAPVQQLLDAFHDAF